MGFPRFAVGRPLLVSGGNDGRVLLWDYGAAVRAARDGAEGGACAPRVVVEVAHGRKARMLAALQRRSRDARVALASPHVCSSPPH